VTVIILHGGQGTPAPLVGPSDTEVSTNEDADSPVTYTPSDLVDKWGLYWVVSEEGDESAAGSEGAVGITGSLQTMQTSGLRNADFTTPPPFPDEYIDDTNPLPGWTFVRPEGSSVAATWVVDSAAPGGYAIAWEMSDFFSIDRAYFEQVAPVMPRAWPTTVATRGSWARACFSARVRMRPSRLRSSLVMPRPPYQGGQGTAGSGADWPAASTTGQARTAAPAGSR
jgi:hypothetical protein